MHVEFLGIPRERTGVSEVEVHAATLGELLGAIASRFPQFGDLISARGMHRSLAANLNGDTFVSDPETTLGANDRVLLLSADVGG